MRRNSLRRQHVLVLTGLFLVAVLAVAGFGWAVRADAQTTFSVESIGGQLGLGDADLRQVILNIIRWALGVLTLVAVVYMMYGGYLWLTAAGNEKRVEKAKQVILQAAIGLVIVLLAWAIVFFVTRSLANVTNPRGQTNNPGDPVCDPITGNCPELTKFDITNIASCSTALPNENVPRSSAIQLTFNANLKAGTVEQAVKDDVTNANPPNLIIQECANNDCTVSTNLSTPVPLENQKFTTGTKATTTGIPQADWIQNGKVVTFYHVANDTLAADARLFKPNQKYLLTVPAKTASKALRDQKDRTVQNCRRQTSSLVSLPGCNATDPDRITWEFTTGADTDGPALSVSSAYPSFNYQSSDVSPNRAVSRASFLSVQFNTPIDFNTLTTDNFRVFKCSAANTPTATNDWNDCDDETGNQVPASNYVIEPRPDGRGGILRIADPAVGTDPFRYEAFAWYKVEVRDVRSLCGRVQDPSPKTWVFQTNDRVPGVKKVYPRDGVTNACPATKTFIQYATSMWDGSTFDCNVGAGSYVTQGTLRSGATSYRNLIPIGVFDEDDPETCTLYEFATTATLLPPNRNFEARVESDLVINTNGKKLNYGYNIQNGTSEGPWAFKTATAATCVQEPVITRVLPGQGPDGQCLSVIGEYFEKVNTADQRPNEPDNGDKLELRATNQSADSWTNTYIVSTLNRNVDPAAPLALNRAHPYTVTVNYPAPIGPITSGPEDFYLTDDPAAQGPCLTRLSPTNGPIDTKVTAYGKRLGSNGAVHYSSKNPPDWTVTGAWTENRIDDVNVDGGSPVGSGLVTVLPSANGSGESNPLPFVVTQPTVAPGTTPRVLETTTCSRTTSPSPNPQNGETSACINAWPSARFNVELDPATLNTSTIVLEQCAADFTGCAPLAGAQVLPAAGMRGFSINPGGNLTPSTAYRVTISGIESADGVAMTTPYSWRFTTKAGNAECDITRVIINQSDRTFSRAFSLGLPTVVTDEACNEVDGTGLTYSWSNSVPAVCDLLPSYTGPSNICQSNNPMVDEGTTDVRVSLASENLDSNIVKITADLVACESSAQCACGTNTTSQCINNKCTPVVTSISPDNGRVGTWATIRGCWFGKYAASTSKVLFTDNKEGLIPTSPSNACTAGNTWSNTQIVREVPQLESPTNDINNDAVTGPIRVVRGDGVATTGPTFTVNSTEYTKICRIDPTSRYPTETVTVYGRDLGDNQAAGDKLEITDDDTLTVTPFASYPQWDADRIGAVVPTPGATPDVFGRGNVRAVIQGVPSNTLEMTILDPSTSTGTDACTTRCVFGDDSVCGPGRGCGFNNCCADRPRVITPNGTRPANGETDVCRNTQVEVDFTQPLLSSSVTPATVRYFNGPNVVNGKIALTNAGKTITYTPGLLSPLMDQRLSLAPVASTPITVANPSFETGVSSGWNATPTMQTSPDVPPGGGAMSALADCTTVGCVDANVVQDIDGVSSAVRGYRVTGWLKADVPVGARAGLITQCSSGSTSSCGSTERKITFDRWNDAPGLVYNIGGTARITFDWKKIDFIVSNPTGKNIGLRLNCFAQTGAKIWCDDITVTRVVEQPTFLRGKTGVLADVTYNAPVASNIFNYSFTSSEAICTLDRVVVTPATQILTASGQTFTPLAQAFSGRRAPPLSEVPGVYEWDWRWERNGGSDAIATVQNQNAETTTVTAGTTNGTIRAKATARVTVDANNNATLNREVSGQSKVTVDFCETPWTFTDAPANCTSGTNNASTCPSFHFKLYYCASATEPRFDRQAIEGQNQVDPERKKSFFLKENANSTDVIGILIYENTELLSPFDWYKSRFSGSGSTTTIGGFPAYRTGTTAYIGITDLTDAGQLAGYMVVIDFNSNDASSATQSIYNRILKSIEFNATQTTLSDNDREAIIRDTQRVQDIRSIKTLLTAYKKANGRYPDLPAGSFITGFSTSTWPSWQKELANALGRGLPTDPLNGFTPGVCQAPYEASSCWAEPTKQFQCPVGSQIYSYKTISNGTSYELYGNLQYTGIGGFNNFSGNPCTGLGTGNTCACFNYRVAP